MSPSYEREQALFILAAAKPVAERAAFLDRECGGDKALRARLEALLVAHDQPEPIMDAPVARATMKIELAEVPDEAIGHKIGRYKILERVGEGGCGVVYVAEQTEPVRRRVALKVIKLGMDTKQVVARFEAERQALAMMDHPNIAKVLDAGSTETGRPYFVMELVRGIKITDYCDQASLPTNDRLGLFIQVCHAIQHAHQKGIIHRDIKPSNILVTLNDGVPVPKVIDFGIAKATEGRLTDATVYTQLHQFIGTPAYMSPEQAEMSSLDIDTRSDIYSLGVLLYELLAGATPFDAQELMSLGIEAMRKTIREQEPLRPSTRLATLRGNDLTTAAKRRAIEAPKLIHLLKGDLDWIVMKCLEKERARRYETANGLAADLKRHLGNEPVLARPPSAAYRFQKAVRRNKLAFAAGATIVAVLVLGIVASLSQAARAQWEARRALRAEAEAKERLAESQAVSRFMTNVFESPDPTRNGRTITVAETLDRAATNLEHDLATQPAVRALLQETLAETYGALGLPREAIPLQEQGRDYYLKIYGPEHFATMAAMNDLGNFYFNAGRLDDALKMREQVLGLARKMLGAENTYTLKSIANLSCSYRVAGRTNDALKLAEEELQLSRKLSGPESLDTLTAMSVLALAYGDIARPQDALKMREDVLALSRKMNGPEHPYTLAAMLNLASSYDDVGREDEALKLDEQLLPLDRKVLGPENPDTLSAMHNLALLYYGAGRRDEAIKMQEEVLALRRRTNGPDHPDSIRAMSSLASSYADTGRGDEALKLQEEVFRRSSKVNGPENPYTLSAMHSLAVSYDAVGRRDEALKLREGLLPLIRKVFGPEHQDTLVTMNELAWTLATSDAATMRNGREAVKLAEEAVALNARKDPGLLDTLAAAYAETQQFEKACAVEREAIALYPTEALKKEGESHLSLFQANKPYREPSKPEDLWNWSLRS